MNSWLLLDVQLKFHNKIQTKYPRLYWPDVAADGADILYGMHFVSAPKEIHGGDEISARILLRAFPQDLCSSFQPGTKIYVKEGSHTMADGIITNRVEHQSPATTLSEILKELTAIQ